MPGAAFVAAEPTHDADRRGDDPRLAAALAKLSPRQRTAVMLVHGHGYTLAAAAEVLGVSVSSLRNHVARGIGHLRDDLDDLDDLEEVAR